LAWLGLDWLGLAWLGFAWIGLAWLGLAWLGLAWSQPFFIDLPMKMETIESSETSPRNTQKPGIYPKERKLYLEHGGNLKPRIELRTLLNSRFFLNYIERRN
jgi:hypothetical protein